MVVMVFWMVRCQVDSSVFSVVARVLQCGF